MAGGERRGETEVALAGILEWRSQSRLRFRARHSADVIVESLSFYGTRLRILNHLGPFGVDHRVRVWIDGVMSKARVIWADGDQIRVTFINPSEEFLDTLRAILKIGNPGWGAWTRPAA